MEVNPVPWFCADCLKYFCQCCESVYTLKMLQMRLGLEYTLVFIKNNTNILLGLKKRGFGEGKWNGFGGKLEANETIFQGAIRETKEECNLDIDSPKHIGILTYQELKCKKVDIVHVFTAAKYSNDLRESDEMKPQWFDINSMPYDQMWPDFKVWSSYMSKEKYFHAHTIYDEDEKFKNCTVKVFKNIDSAKDNVQNFMKNITNQ